MVRTQNRGPTDRPDDQTCTTTRTVFTLGPDCVCVCFGSMAMILIEHKQANKQAQAPLHSEPI